MFENRFVTVLKASVGPPESALLIGSQFFHRLARFSDVRSVRKHNSRAPRELHTDPGSFHPFYGLHRPIVHAFRQIETSPCFINVLPVLNRAPDKISNLVERVLVAWRIELLARDPKGG